MELINATRMCAGYTLGVEPSGRELLVIAVKGTFSIPRSGEPVRLLEQQVPLVMADIFSGEPGHSAPLFEVDFAPRKAACDVLLVGNAHAQTGRAATLVDVGLQVGPLRKDIRVIGDRVWRNGMGGLQPSAPRPFARLPLSYDCAFGGTDPATVGAELRNAYRANPVGRGFGHASSTASLSGTPLPNTESATDPVTRPDGAYRPMAYGPVGRGWQQRACYAGTYDAEWLSDFYPFLPRDFDERYYQAAPLDQQIPIPGAPVPVTLTNLTADGMRRFLIPCFDAPVQVFPRRGGCESHAARLDTIVLEPELERFTLTWRVTRSLSRNLFEVAQALIGRKGRHWWQAREELVLPGSNSALALQVEV